VVTFSSKFQLINLRNKVLPTLVVLFAIAVFSTFAGSVSYSRDDISGKLILASWIAAWSILFSATWREQMMQSRGDFWRHSAVALVFVSSMTVGLIMWLDLTLDGSLINTDFTQDYLAGYALRHDTNIYGPSLKALAMKLFGFEAENYHPPFNALLFIPLSYLPYRGAFVVWSVLSLVGFGVLVVYSLHAYGMAKYPWLPLSSLLLLWKPFTSSIWLGQLSVFLALLIVLGFACLKRQREGVAGLLFGLATLIKFFPGLLLLYVLVQRRWRCAVTWVICVAVGLLVSLAVAGSADGLYYIKQILPEQMRLFASFPFNISIEGIARTIFGPTEYFAPARELAPGTVRALVWFINGSLVIAVCRLGLRCRDPESDTEMFSLFCVTMLLVSPLTWGHTCLMLVLPMALLLHGALFQGRLGELRVLIVVLALFAVPDPVVLTSLIEIYQPQDVPWYVLVAAKTGSFALLTLWVILWLKLHRRNPCRSARNESEGYVSVHHQ